MTEEDRPVRMELFTGFGLQGFRSFYGPMQYIGPLERINLIAGQNNSGKSSVLEFAAKISDPSGYVPTNLDIPSGISHASEFAYATSLTPVERVLNDSFPAGSNDNFREIAETLLTCPILSPIKNGHLWLQWHTASKNQTDPPTLRRQAQSLVDFQMAGSISSTIYDVLRNQFRVGSSTQPREIFEAFLNRLNSDYRKFPNVIQVAASRRISMAERSDISTLINGDGLIGRLATLQNPLIHDRADGARFKAINEFAQSVLNDPTAQLHIPHDASDIYVERGDLVLPLSHLGTGVTQVIILAAAATLESDKLVCVEEPEVHLHPLLQRKLLRYLYERTDNQYLIATHSAHLLDSNLANVFHATLTTNGTEIAHAGTPQNLADICSDLGYRPSDLIQANATIWVEGPSDRIYIRHWISLADPRLREHIDYSIMFYGGRLLNHLSAQDSEVSNFIQLRRLNRHLVVVMDSDQTSVSDSINDTKRRVIEELAGDPNSGIAWVTSGRTIENYVPLDLLRAAVKQTGFTKELTSPVDQWTDVLRPTDPAKSPKPDKVKIARTVVSRWSSGLEYRGLRDAVVMIVELLQKANDLDKVAIDSSGPQWAKQDS